MVAKDKIVSAGGIVYRVNNDVVEIKLIKTVKKRWSLPKGRIENNEDIQTCALREVREESGAEAQIESFIDTVEYEIKYGLKVVHIYLMKCVQDNEFNDPDGEIIKAEWKTLEKALELVDFPPMRKVLKQAVKILGKKK